MLFPECTDFLFVCLSGLVWDRFTGYKQDRKHLQSRNYWLNWDFLLKWVCPGFFFLKLLVLMNIFCYYLVKNLISCTTKCIFVEIVTFECATTASFLKFPYSNIFLAGVFCYNLKLPGTDIFSRIVIFWGEEEESCFNLAGNLLI